MNHLRNDNKAVSKNIATMYMYDICCYLSQLPSSVLPVTCARRVEEDENVSTDITSSSSY